MTANTFAPFLRWPFDPSAILRPDPEDEPDYEAQCSQAAGEYMSHKHTVIPTLTTGLIVDHVEQWNRKAAKV